MKYALIGCGKIAINHIKAVVNNNLDLVALCDIEDSHIDKLVEATGYNKTFKRYSDYKKMLQENPEIDLVGIATDSGTHAKIALYCIDKGINIILEKPIAMSMSDAYEIIKRGEQHNVKITVCMQNRFNTAVQNLKCAIDKGRFGKLSHGAVAIRWYRDAAYYSQDSWRGKWASDGGTLMNQCVHGVDLLRWMMGDEVDEVYGVTRRQFHDYIEGEDLGMAVLKFKNGAIGTIEATVNVFNENLEETLYIFGENGTVKLGGVACNNIDIWKFADEEKEDVECAGFKGETSNVYGRGHTNVYADMIEAIKENRKPYIDITAGKNAMEISLAIYKSQLTGLPVKLPLDDFSTNDLVGIFDK